MEYKEFFESEQLIQLEEYARQLHNSMEVVKKEEECVHCSSKTIEGDVLGLIKTIVEAKHYLIDLYIQFKSFNMHKFMVGFGNVVNDFKEDIKEIGKGLFSSIKISEFKAPKLSSETNVKNEIIRMETGLIETLIKLHRLIDGDDTFKWVITWIDKAITRIKKLV